MRLPKRVPVFLALPSEVHRNRSNAERGALSLRHSVDLVVDPDAEMLSAPVSQNPVFLESHVEGVDREEVPAEIRPVLSLAKVVFEGSKGAVWPVFVRFRGW